MSKHVVPYTPDQYEQVMAEVQALAPYKIRDVTVDLVDGQPTTCYIEYETEPTPTSEELLAEADQRILDLEYELLLLQEELT